jgi:DNA modification methylase
VETDLVDTVQGGTVPADMLDQIIQGDCLEVMKQLPDGCVDAVITDPPYMVGAISVGTGNAKAGTWADMQNAAHWFAAWFQESRRVLSQAGFLSSCGNWRSIPTLICALSRCSWAATSCLIWDKQWIGPAYKNAFRPTYELALVAAMPEAEIQDRTVSDIYRGGKWLAGQCRTTEHPAEKPVDLMEHLVQHLSPSEGLILDPFCGSGTTCVAAKRLGRHYIGIELDERYCEIARNRLAGTEKPLFAEAQ